MDRQNDYLGVNKIGKNIRKSPLHQPSFGSNAAASSSSSAAPSRAQTQPQVYNISKNDFRSIVQQLTGSPARDSLPRPLPPQNGSPKPQNTRLQRIRPAPLTDLNRPAVPLPNMMAPPQQQQQQQPYYPYSNRPPPPQQSHFQQPMMMSHGDQFWSNTAESPVSEYMRYLQSSPGGNQMQQPGHEHQPYMPAQPQYQPQSQLRPYMPVQPQYQPQFRPHMMQGPSPLQPNQYQPPPPGLVPSPLPRDLPSPRFNGPVPITPTMPSPRFNQLYGGLASPRYNGFGQGQLHSPTSQFLQPSTNGYPSNGYPNMFSPRSPYPLLSPGVQYPQPLTPNFSFSQLAQQPGSLGPGSGLPQPPPSPGLMFPPSPSGFFPTIQSPRWNGY